MSLSEIEFEDLRETRQMLAVVLWFEALPEEPVRFVTVIVSHCPHDRRSFTGCQHYKRKVNLIAGLLPRRIQIGVDQNAFRIFAMF